MKMRKRRREEGEYEMSKKIFELNGLTCGNVANRKESAAIINPNTAIMIETSI